MRSSVFIAQYPNCYLFSEGIPCICPNTIDDTHDHCEDCDCKCGCCYAKYWGQEIDY